MDENLRYCRCNILNAREEKLLNEDGRVQVRLVCNDCGAIRTAETRKRPVTAARKAAEREAEEAR